MLERRKDNRELRIWDRNREQRISNIKKMRMKNREYRMTTENRELRIENRAQQWIIVNIEQKMADIENRAQGIAIREESIKNKEQRTGHRENK